MDLILLSDRYAPEARAAAYLSHHMGKALHLRGHSVQVITRCPTGFVPDSRATELGDRVEDGVRVRRLRPWSAGSEMWRRGLDQIVVSVKAALALLRYPKPDAVLVLSPPLLFAVPALIVSRLRRIPAVLNLHDIYPQAAIDLNVLRNPVLIRIASFLEWMSYRLASRILVAAPASRRLLIERRGVAPARVAILNNFVHLDDWEVHPRQNQFRREHGLTDSFVILFAGLMGLAQDLDVVLRCARTCQDRASWSFLLVGDGPRAAYWREAAADLPNVRFMGPLGEVDYFEALRAADACLVPLDAKFRSPAVPGKTATILACARPVIALTPDGNDTQQIISDAGCGFALRSGDDKALAAALDALASDPAKAEAMGLRGNAYARAHLSLAGAVLKCEEVLVAAASKSQPQDLESNAEKA